MYVHKCDKRGVLKITLELFTAKAADGKSLFEMTSLVEVDEAYEDA